MTKLAWMIYAAAWLVPATFGFEPQDYVFELTAETSVDPVGIVISWPQKHGGDIAVRRKPPADDTWGPVITTLPANATSFADSNIQIGVAYDYEISAPI